MWQRIVLVFSPHLSPLCLFQHIVPPPQRPLIRKCDLALCTCEQQALFLLLFLPSALLWCLPHSDVKLSTKNEFSTDKDLVLSLSSSCLSTSSLRLSSSLFHRNSKASTSSRYISLLPTVTWHCRPDPPSARMVSTTVSKSFFYYSLHCILYSNSNHML